MKKIMLYGASVRNDGTYVDAGTTLIVGSSPREISAERAKVRIDAGRAIDATSKASA